MAVRGDRPIRKEISQRAERLVHMKIAVRNRDYGFFSAQPVSVQVYHKGYLISCNHDGYFEDEYDTDIIRSDDTIRTVWNTYEVCDKCNAYRQLGEEEWRDEV